MKMSPSSSFQFVQIKNHSINRRGRTAFTIRGLSSFWRSPFSRETKGTPKSETPIDNDTCARRFIAPNYCSITAHFTACRKI